MFNYNFCENLSRENKFSVCFNTEDGFIKEFIQTKHSAMKFFPVRVVSDHAGKFEHEIDKEGKKKACDILRQIAPDIVDYFLAISF